jgi:hypothetical protein
MHERCHRESFTQLRFQRYKTHHGKKKLALGNAKEQNISILTQLKSVKIPFFNKGKGSSHKWDEKQAGNSGAKCLPATV